MAQHAVQRTSPGRRSRYSAPRDQHQYLLPDLLQRIGRAELEPKQYDMLRRDMSGDPSVYYSGNLDLLDAPAVSIVGTREVSEPGWRRAYQLARSLSAAGVTVVSGLAKGVDTAALTGAVDNGGHAVAVIGTPLDKAYPAENAELQQTIYAQHLLLSPFRNGERIFKSNFPVRNRVMAAISDATVIIEASDTSGTLHQASECVKLNRWLFIAKSVIDDRSLKWPAKFLDYEKTAALTSVEDVLSRLEA
ncbi:DNA-processing protein DprA [Bradyrhizobium sp. OK095]|uniref:DNA-processing protein DprA n=1 Tax=Bradyrhizobium sp. OK095 TaxID=1882760 RepID=UPI000B89E486|nr:DNA-processing protein DprA [Bradyrhizobium sp. OK095]